MQKIETGMKEFKQEGILQRKLESINNWVKSQIDVLLNGTLFVKYTLG